MVNLYTQLAVLIASLAMSLICRLVWLKLDQTDNLNIKLSSILIIGKCSWVVTFLNIGYIVGGYHTGTLIY